MPLFGRRSRSVSVSRPTTPSVTSPALLAASQAMSHQGAQTKLATGAAAAALRSMSPATTPVSQVQTKRMMERQTSVGSQNAQRGRSRGNGIHRRSSSSSMTERTFRDPSPGRPSTASGVPISRGQEPPVPPVPDTYANVPPIPVKSQRRSASIDGYRPPMAAAAQSVNRNSMIDTRTSKPAANPGLAAARKVAGGSSAASALERMDSNGSVNFSYPNRARPNSPPPSRLSIDSPTSPVAKPATPKGISQTEALRIQNELLQASQQPVKKKKQRDGPLTEGSRLQTGTMGTKPVTTPLGPNTAPAATPSPRAQEKDPNSAKLAGQASHFPSSPVSPTDSQGSMSDSEKSRTRRAHRASGALQKQPSVVREDPEGELEEANSVVGTSPTPVRTTVKPQTPEANVSRKIETNNQKQAELISAATTLRTHQARQPSLSPARSTRFSNRLSADMTEGQKHEPPPRSLSPRKPALKHSPSPQTARQSQRDSSISPSEAGTDTSTEGHSRSRKPAHHVTFDSTPAIVGISAEPETPVSPVAKSPQDVEKDKRWSALGNKQQKRVVLSEGSDEDEPMKPRSALPTFSSVRTRKNDPIAAQNHRSPSLSSSSTSSLVSDTGPNTMETSISSDHAVGGLLAREAEQKPSFVDASIGESGLKTHNEERIALDTSTAETRATGQESAHSADSHLPSIAVQPATPGDEISEPKDQWLVNVPGSFDQEKEAEHSAEIQQKPVMLSQQTTIMPRSSLDTDLDRPRMPSIQEEDSDRDSVYSDAAEDLSDLEGDGFGSINAIVRSPVAPSPIARSSPPESPIIAAPRREVPVTNESGVSEWSDTQARWKDKAESAKRGALQPAAQIVEKTPTQSKKDSYSQPVSSRSVQSSSPASPTSNNQGPSAVGPVGLYGRGQAQPAMRKSMRDAADDTPPRSMRNRPRADSEEEVQKPLRSSMRASPTPTRAAVVAVPPAAVQGALQKKNLRSSAPPVQQKLPLVQDDSESDSSFRRRRRAKAKDNNKYSMRTSMRAGSAAPEVRPSVAQRQAVRSMSPVERRPFSPVGGQSAMKTTLRGSTDAAPSLRNKPPTTERRSSSLFGRRKEAKSPTRPMSVSGFGKSKFASDSDDEGTKPAQGFKSRYADSSDEEDLRPVRGIPRRNRDDDSTDLDDSSDEEAEKKKKTTIAVPPIPQIPERPSSPMSLNSKKKRGWFGRKKDREETVPSDPIVLPSTNGKEKASGKKPKQSGETAALGFSSDAQKEALIEQTRQRLLAANEPASPSTQSPTPGKLQRRQTPQRVASESWPLPPKIPDTEDLPARPYTSDGPATPTRPELNRLSSSATAATSPASPTGSGSTSRTGKKKRFPLLRKAFGLKD